MATYKVMRFYCTSKSQRLDITAPEKFLMATEQFQFLCNIYTPGVNKYASRIPNIFCQKSQQVGHGRAIQAPAGRASPIWQFSWLGMQELVQPFHVLFVKISNKIYLESLRHTCSPCAFSFIVPFNFTRFLISALWYAFLLCLPYQHISLLGFHLCKREIYLSAHLGQGQKKFFAVQFLSLKRSIFNQERPHSLFQK